MKTIADFGEFVRESLWLWLCVFAILGVAIYSAVGVHTVTLDAKHWECTLAKPEGLGAKCLEYVYKGR